MRDRREYIKLIEGSGEKIVELTLLRLSDEIGLDGVNRGIKLIHADILNRDVVPQHVKDWNVFMSIVDGSVVQTLIHDGFQNIEVPFIVMPRPCYNVKIRDFVSQPVRILQRVKHVHKISDYALHTLYTSMESKKDTIPESYIEMSQRKNNKTPTTLK